MIESRQGLDKIVGEPHPAGESSTVGGIHDSVHLNHKDRSSQPTECIRIKSVGQKTNSFVTSTNEPLWLKLPGDLHPIKRSHNSLKLNGVANSASNDEGENTADAVNGFPDPSDPDSNLELNGCYDQQCWDRSHAETCSHAEYKNLRECPDNFSNFDGTAVSEMNYNTNCSCLPISGSNPGLIHASLSKESIQGNVCNIHNFVKVPFEFS